jgi:hypothetical protein
VSVLPVARKDNFFTASCPRFINSGLLFVPGLLFRGGMLLTQRIKGGLQGRIGLTIYYGFVCALAVRWCASIPSGRGVVDELSYWHMVLYASFALASWWLLRSFRRTSDRIAALLYGLFYAIRIGAHFITGADTLVLARVECAIISAGMIAMIVGMIHAVSHEEPDNSAMGNPSS